MNYLTQDKLVIVGAAGMIGSNMAQTAMMMNLTPNICLYDPFEPALQGVAEELRHCGFEGADIQYTTDIAVALKDAAYIVSSGGAPRKADMTREDLLKGNALIAEQLGKDIKTYAPNAKFVVVIFNPADITGLITLIYSGLKPSQVATLAALDSTRLQSEIAKQMNVPMSEVKGARTYGGHGEQMAVFASPITVRGEPLNSIIGSSRFSSQAWNELRERVVQGGKMIINLRGRSSFQSPAYLSIEMIAAAMGGNPFRWPVGAYIDNDKYSHVVMATETAITKDGVELLPIKGTPEEFAELDNSYKHLCELRDEVIAMGVLPPVDKWHEINPNIK